MSPQTTVTETVTDSSPRGPRKRQGSATPGMLVVAAAIVAATVGLAVAHRRMFAPWAAGGGDGTDGGAPRTAVERMTPASLVSR